MIEVVLDKSKFGNTNEDGLLYDFYVLRDGKEEFLTQRRGTGKLIAVTDEQYKSWKNQNIIARLVE
jgi:hypothetical protein